MRIQRTLPPVAAPLSVHDLLHGLAGIFLGKKNLRKLEAEIQDYFRVKHVFFVSSGKAALTLILGALKSLSSRQHVVIPAYTCFSVPSAIVKAGLNVSLCDVDLESLDFNFDCLQPLIGANPLCVIPTHLLGLPSDVDRVKGLCQDKGVFVVEDVAQAMGVKHRGRLLGTRGDVAFFSLGRGKNITCGSGGVILTNTDAIAQAIRVEYAKLRKESVISILKNWSQTLAMGILIHPWLYWFPAGLPFLKLGETTFYRDFPIHRLDGIRAGLLAHWREELELSNHRRRLRAQDFIRRLATVNEVARPISHPDAIYLRLPLVMKNKEIKEQLCAQSDRDGLGISPLYPTSVEAIPELQGMLPNKELNAAGLLPDCLVTLPTHHFVSEKDLDKIFDLLAQLRETLSHDTACSGVTDFGQRRLSARA